MNDMTNTYYLQYDDGRGWTNKEWDVESSPLVESARNHRQRWPLDRLRLRHIIGDIDTIISDWDIDAAIS